MTLYIAIDHQDRSIERYLGTKSTEASLRQFRRNVATMVIKGGEIDGVVLAAEDLAWSMDKIGPNQVLFGLPDLSDVAIVGTALSNKVNSAPFEPAAIKIGFPLNGDLSAICQSVDHLVRLFEMARNGLNWIVEPYFHSSLDIELRAEFLQRAAKLNSIAGFKLDLDNPQKNSAVYTQAAGNKPWFSRSDGLQFLPFSERLDIAVKRGCSGAIVGAAIWSAEAPLIAKEAHSAIAERNILSKILAVQRIIDEAG
jgi:hypothetical protein